MSKAQSTKEQILKSALHLTSKFGLESLSIGELAKSVGMSKSGLFGHFKSKEKLQIMVMDYAADNFVRKIIKPAIKEKRGLARLNAMMINWKTWSGTYMPGGCPFLSSIVEFDDRPGKVRDHIQKLQNQMIGSFERALEIAMLENEIKKSSNIELAAYQIYSCMIGYHIYNRLMAHKDAHKMFSISIEEIINNLKA